MSAENIASIGGGPGHSDIASKEEEDMTMVMYTFLYVTFSGFIMSTLYMIINFVYLWIRRRLVCSITIQSSDAVYKIVLDFLSQ